MDSQSSESRGPTRRDFLRFLSAGSLVSLLSGCQRYRPSPGVCTVSHPVIDVHCHFFNASDVPVEGFVRYVVLGEDEPQIIFRRHGFAAQRFSDAFIVFLVVLLSQAAPLAHTEAIRLAQRTALPSRGDTTARKREALANALLELDLLARDVRKTTEFTTERFSAHPNYDGLLEEFRATAGIRIKRGLTDERMQSGEARALAAALLERGEFRRYLAFALLFLDYREALAREYIRIFGQNDCVSLITPSFLDMEKWLLGGGPRSKLDDQVDVMDALQVRIADSTDVHMHSFIGFDPWREIVEGGVLARVQRAVNEQGFIGVKLYPPMGFRAWGNETLPSLPQHLPPHLRPHFRDQLNRALRRLYNWCIAEDVPILAHAENSLGPNCGYGKRASPWWWRKLLRVDGYADLRINLAHFGAFDEVMHRGEFPTSRSSCPDDQYMGKAWETIIGETIRDDGRPYLFADLSYLHELVSPEFDEEYRRRIRANLEQFIATYDRDVRHLVYGTDWTMIGQEPDHNLYLSRIHQQLTQIGLNSDQLQNVFWKNAARYLGLVRGGKSRVRIANYCSDRGLKKSWLNAFATA
jgi:predicted TIM-barrel fold metal-dependent hydrolase